MFHLVWAPLGIEVFRRFLASYRGRPAGMPHRLHILFNGFMTGDELGPYRDAIADIPHDSTVLERPVQDIQAYLDGAKLVDSEYVCFLNSYSELLADGWLAILDAHASRGGVGLVGATGSHESHVPRILQHYNPPALDLGLNPFGWPAAAYRRVRATAYQRKLLRCYDPFPNPHLRSNACMLRRDLLLGLGFGPIRDKEDAFRFESGRAGLSRRILRAGLDVLIVGKDGLAYRVEEWPESRTFRCGGQSNLLVSDNQTNNFDVADIEGRKFLSLLAWGERAGHSREFDHDRQQSARQSV